MPALAAKHAKLNALSVRLKSRNKDMGKIGIIFLDSFSIINKLKEGKIVFSVYGLGYVGLTLAAVWLRAGAKVIGVDIDLKKLEKIKKLEYKFPEEEIKEAIKAGFSQKRFMVTNDGIDASKKSDVKIVTVPVYLKNGEPNLKAIEDVTYAIAKGLCKGDLVIIESSVPPGTTFHIKKLLEETSGLNVEKDFGLGYSPERIYIGRGVKDIEERYPKIISGVGERSIKTIKVLYEHVCKKGTIVASSPIVAEVEKLFEGIYRDVNIALANELARLCCALNIDYREVRKLANSQPYCNLHLPGTGVGGACIPVYPIFVLSAARKCSEELMLVKLARKINSEQPQKIAELCLKAYEEIGVPRPKICVLGLAFRGDIDDTRLSPTYSLIQSLLHRIRDCIIIVHDPYVIKDYFIEKHGLKLTSELKHALSGADMVILATNHSLYRSLSLKLIKIISGKEKVAVIDAHNMLSDWRNPPKGVIYVGSGRPWVKNL